jgi:hypothetical protein
LLKAGTNGRHIIEKFRDKCPQGSKLCTGLSVVAHTSSIFLSFRCTAPYKDKNRRMALVLKGTMPKEYFIVAAWVKQWIIPAFTFKNCVFL